MYPFNEDRDENIGGGRSNVPDTFSVERKALTIGYDRKLRMLKRYKELVGDCYDQTDDITKEIINELYFKRHPTLTVRGVAQKIHSSRNTVSRKRKAFIEAIADGLGW